MIHRLRKILYPVFTIILLNFTVLYFQSCEQDFTADPPASTVPFPDEITAIFNMPLTNGLTCATSSCHSNSNNQSGMNLEDWSAAMKGSNNGTMIIPYNGFWSHLTSVVNSDTTVGPVSTVLLPEYHKLEASKVATLMTWMNNGAPSKDGQVAYTSISNSDKGFITNQAADVVAVIQPNAKRVTRLISVGGRPSNLDAPHYVEISPDKAYFYVSLIQEGYVEKYDANTYVRVGRMPAGQSPAHIAISPDGLTGYVTNFESSGTVTTTTRFDAANMSVTGVFSEPRMKGPHGMALTRDGSTLFVASEIGEYIFRINTSMFYASDTSYIRAPIDPSVPPSGNGTGNFKPYQIILSPDESLLYISCRGANQVRVYNANTLEQVNAINLGASAYPLLMNLTSNGQQLFVCNRNNNTVSVISTQSQTVIKTIDSVGIQPHGVDFSSDGLYAIIACETVAGFDGHHPTVGSTRPGTSRYIRLSDLTLMPDRMEMGSFPAGIMFMKQ